jgi:hypothetical protein
MSNGRGFGPGFGSPGQRDIRYSRWADEKKRILDTIKWMIVFALGILVSLFADAVILGPWIGWMVILIVVCVPLIMYAVYPLLKASRSPYATLAIGLPFAGILVAWALIGYPWVESLWPPFYKDVQAFLPIWASCLILIALLFLKVVFSWGIWGMFSELVDPNGPTAPRQATARETTIYPWHPDTYGGKVVPEIESPIALPQPVSRVQVTSADGRHMQEVLIPNTPQWKSFAAVVVAKHDANIPPDKLGFTEYEARRHGIKLVPKLDSNGVVLFPGFRTVRDHFITLSWAHWKNTDAHNQGIILHEQAIAALRAIANGHPSLERERREIPQPAG